MTDILSFRGKHRWLSNFHPCNVSLDGVSYPSSEHAYQAAKTEDKVLRERIRTGTAAESKKLAKSFSLPESWNEKKLVVMEELLNQKFSNSNLELQALLKETSGEIVEGNYWHDNFFGVCVCEKCNNQGMNHLGKLLMKIRSSIQS